MHLDGTIDQAHPAKFAQAVQKIVRALVDLAATEDANKDIRLLSDKHVVGCILVRSRSGHLNAVWLDLLGPPCTLDVLDT